MISVVSSDSQWIAYFVVTVIVLAMVYCLLKQLTGNAEAEQEPIGHQDARHHETEPIMPRKEVFVSYGATEEQPESSVKPAKDSYSEKMCKVCFDEPQSCFFIPCGHSVTCLTCARRIVEEENKACPICRRLIHRVRVRSEIQRVTE